MSSPIRKTRSSRSISSRRASRSATRNSFSGMLVHLPLARVEVAVELLDRRVRTLVGESDRLLHLGLHLGADALQLLTADDPGPQELVLEAGDGVAPAPALLFLLGAIPIGVDHRVAPEPIAHRLDEAGLEVATGLLHDLRGSVQDL